MPDSPFLKAGDVVSVDVLVAGKPIADSFELATIEVDRALNRVPTAKITFYLPAGDGDDRTFTISESKDYIPGQEIEIKLGYVDEKKTIFKGLIVSQGIRNLNGDVNEAVVRCSDKSVKMTLGRKSAYYQNMKDSAIIGAILGDYGLGSEVEATTYQHKQIVKYQSNDWDFIGTRAAANGLITYAEDGKVLVKKPLASGAALLELDFGRDVLNFDMNIDARFQTPSMSCKGWDMKTQAMVEGKSAEPTMNQLGNLKAKENGTKIGFADASLATTSPLEAAELKAWADAELVRSRLSQVLGTLTVVGNASPKLNTLVQLKGFGDRFNGDALVTSIRHQVRAGFWQTTIGLGLPPEPFAGTHADVSAPAAAGLLPAISGLQNGTVKKIDADPDGQHRIQVNVPVIDPAGEGIWARMAHFYATKGKGSFFLPEVGDEVILGFLNEDPRFPVILGMLYSSKITPPYTADAENKIKAIVTKNDLKIEFNDTDKILTIKTPGGNEFVLSDKDKSVTLKDQNGNKMEMNNSGITLNSAKDIVLKATGKINLQATSGISAKASGGDVGLEGLNVNAKAQVAFSAQGSAQAELKSTGQTSVKGAMVMIN